MADKLLTLPEVAEELRLTLRTVQMLVQHGHIPCVDLGYKTKRVKRSALDEYINSRETPTCS